MIEQYCKMPGTRRIPRWNKDRRAPK
jgi:hypothetical protein